MSGEVVHERHQRAARASKSLLRKCHGLCSVALFLVTNLSVCTLKVSGGLADDWTDLNCVTFFRHVVQVNVHCNARMNDFYHKTEEISVVHFLAYDSLNQQHAFVKGLILHEIEGRKDNSRVVGKTIIDYSNFL